MPDETTPGVFVPRRMLAIERDTDGIWVATLDCGHRRHLRHQPPLSSYPWLLDDAQRAARIGDAVECGRCVQRELPLGAVEYSRTKMFDEHSLPQGLRAEHNTRTGVWARVEVLAGRLRFVMPVLHVDHVVETDGHTVIPPELVHHVEPLGAMRMRVVFLRVPAPG